MQRYILMNSRIKHNEIETVVEDSQQRRTFISASAVPHCAGKGGGEEGEEELKRNNKITNKQKRLAVLYLRELCITVSSMVL